MDDHDGTNGILIVNIDCIYFVITYCNKKINFKKELPTLSIISILIYAHPTCVK